MQVTRLQIGVYPNQQPFCLYLFPLVTTLAESNSASTKPIYQAFYRLRDIDAIFFNANAGYIYDSGEIPRVYFDTPGYCFYEHSGDVYLSSRALSETAVKLGNTLLAEFCKLSRDDIRAGAADQLLKKVNVQNMISSYVEAEFKFVAIDSRTWASMRQQVVQQHQQQQQQHHHHHHQQQQQQQQHQQHQQRQRQHQYQNHHLQHQQHQQHQQRQRQPHQQYQSQDTSCMTSDQPANERKRSQDGRTSIAYVLDNDNSEVRHESGVTSSTDRNEFDRTPLVKQEPSPANSTLSSPNQRPRSPRSPISASETSVADDDSRRKRRRVTPYNKQTINNPEIMENVSNKNKYKQKKAVGQNRIMQEEIIDRRHSVAGYNSSPSSAVWDSRALYPFTKRNSLSQHRSNRNTKNLKLCSPSNAETSRMCVPRVNRTMSASGPSTSPLISTSTTTGHRASFSGHSSQAMFPSTYKQPSQSQPVHPASRSASIHALISSDCQNTSKDVPSIQVTPSPNPHDQSSKTPEQESLVNNLRQSPSMPPKDSFVQVLDTLYDTVADTHSLKSTLEEQIRKTSALLQTLQTSGLMIETLVRGQVHDMQREVVNDLLSIEKRVSRVEERVKCDASSPPMDSDRRLSDTSTVSNDSGYAGSSQSVMSPRTPEGFNRRESEDVQSKISWNQLIARLESLERRMSFS